MQSFYAYYYYAQLTLCLISLHDIHFHRVKRMLKDVLLSSIRIAIRPTTEIVLVPCNITSRPFISSRKLLNSSDGENGNSDLQDRIEWLEKFHSPTKSETSQQFPKHWITTTFSRSGGAGGQNVNKVNTKAEVRLNLNAAASSTSSDQEIDSNYLPTLTKGIIRTLVNSSPYYVVSSHELKITSTQSRSQSDNVRDAMEKLQSHLVHIISKDIPGKTTDQQRERVKRLIEMENGKRLQSKEKRKAVKGSRRVSRSDF